MFKLTLKMQDGNRETVSKHYVLNAADFATAVGQAATIRAALQAVTKCSIVSQTVSEVVEYAYSANAANKRERVYVTLEKSGKRYPIQWPAPEDGIMAGGQGSTLFDTVDTANADVVAYVTALTDNTLMSDGEDLSGASIISGKRS